MKKILVTGAGGFIGSHLVKRLKDEGYWVRATSRHSPVYGELAQANEYVCFDLFEEANTRQFDELFIDIDEVYHLAADMGGIAYIHADDANTATTNSIIDINCLIAAHKMKVKKFFYASSACVYPAYKQSDSVSNILSEDDAYPAAPDDGYGMAKLFVEHMCQLYAMKGMKTRIGRLHTIYGPYCLYEGERAKAPLALCRKVSESNDRGSIEIWGDGKQSRSILYIDDAITAIRGLMDSGYPSPVNIGASELHTIDSIVDELCKISGKRLTKVHQLDKTQGVRGRCSDNTLIERLLGWTPKVGLHDGLTLTYKWVESQVRSKQEISIW